VREITRFPWLDDQAQRAAQAPIDERVTQAEGVHEMTMAATTADDRAEIRRLLDVWAKAACAGDIDGIMAHYTPDIRSFDGVGPLQLKGADAYRKHWQACLAMCPGSMVFEIHDLEVTVEGDLGLGHYLTRCGATGADGKVQSSWFRATTAFRRTARGWRIVHEHFSAPFDPASGKALLDLVPEPDERASAA
jgi:uncharacterized protein (TIGR02246 family)